MAKREKTNVIALEIERYESKIKEFQDYLEFNNVLSKSWEKESEKHKEIDTQTKLMNALPSWLQGLKSLKEDAEAKSVDLRGGGEMPRMMRKKEEE